MYEFELLNDVALAVTQSMIDLWIKNHSGHP